MRPVSAAVYSHAAFWACTSVLVGWFMLLGTSALWASERPLLLEKHQRVGLACEACHAENPPKAAPSPARCLACHGGDYEKLAQMTEQVTPKNPHMSHEGEVECGECHHVHQPSVDYCGQCHQFGFQVP